MRYKEIEEAARIGTGIHKSEIHPSLRQYPILNRGTTSLILDKDPENVIVLTKDPIKKDWLVNELEIAKQTNYYETNHPKLKDMPIYVLEMPRLYPLGPKTRKAARDLIRTFDDIQSRARSKTGYRSRPGETKEKIISMFYEFFDEYDQNNTDSHALYQLISFIANYGTDQYEWDLRMANLMQDKDENLVILDPIVDKEIIDIFQGRF